MLEGVWSFRLSQLSASVILAVFTFFLTVVTALTIIKTLTRNYLSGYLDVEVRKEITQNALWVDSLERMTEIQSPHLDNAVGVISGTMPLDSTRQIDSLASNDIDYGIPRSKEETHSMKDYGEEEKHNLSVLAGLNRVPTEGVFFYKPMNGVIIPHYGTDVHHYSVDLAVAPKESVLATLDSMMIYTGSDPNYGNVAQLQHKNGLISVCKYNGLSLKKIGDHVVTGEAVVLVGNTEELSTGPYLHFEL